ncbi:MAG: cytochrome c oxidase assembly protein, partial [Acidimicrobiales bacterium]
MTTPAVAALAPLARRIRYIFGGLAVFVVIVAVAPPLSSDARRYVLAGAIQFSLIALAMPALVALWAPTSRITSRWDAERLARLVARREAIRNSRDGLVRLVLRLLPYLAALILWRIPVSVDALATSPVLVAAEIATFAVVGVVFWMELVPSPPVPPIVSSGQRIVPAAVAMWMIWILAYFVGFSHAAWFPSVHPNRRGLGVVADQELSSGALWIAAAATFLP